jgi:hypothetical protein
MSYPSLAEDMLDDLYVSVLLAVDYLIPRQRPPVLQANVPAQLALKLADIIS